MLKRETMKVVLTIALIVGSVSLLDYLVPNLEGTMRGVLVLILAIAALLLIGRLIPGQEIVKSNAFSGLMAVVSFTVAWISNSWINAQLGFVNYNSITNGIYNFPTLLSFLISMVFFGITYWALLKLYLVFVNQDADE